jgi:hypothetical protein
MAIVIITHDPGGRRDGRRHRRDVRGADRRERHHGRDSPARAPDTWGWRRYRASSAIATSRRPIPGSPPSLIRPRPAATSPTLPVRAARPLRIDPQLEATSAETDHFVAPAGTGDAKAPVGSLSEGATPEEAKARAGFPEGSPVG